MSEQDFSKKIQELNNQVDSLKSKGSLDGLKKPETLVTVANTAGLIALAYYYWKNNEKLNQYIADNDVKMNNLIKTLPGMKDTIEKQESLIKELTKEVNSLKKEIENSREEKTDEKSSASMVDLKRVISALESRDFGFSSSKKENGHTEHMNGTKNSNKKKVAGHETDDLIDYVSEKLDE